MKKVVRIMALILAFATELNDEVDITRPVEICVQLKYDIEVKNDNYASLFPEIDIAIVDHLLKFSNDEVYVYIRLADTSSDAGEKAVAALEGNQYVERATTGDIVSIYGPEVTYIPRDGDVNEDGVVSNLNIVSIARYVVSWRMEEGTRIIRADINKDYLITNADLVAVAQMLIA